MACAAVLLASVSAAVLRGAPMQSAMSYGAWGCLGVVAAFFISPYGSRGFRIRFLRLAVPAMVRTLRIPTDAKVMEIPVPPSLSGRPGKRRAAILSELHACGFRPLTTVDIPQAARSRNVDYRVVVEVFVSPETTTLAHLSSQWQGAQLNPQSPELVLRTFFTDGGVHETGRSRKPPEYPLPPGFSAESFPDVSLAELFELHEAIVHERGGEPADVTKVMGPSIALERRMLHEYLVANGIFEPADAKGMHRVTRLGARWAVSAETAALDPAYTANLDATASDRRAKLLATK